MFLILTYFPPIYFFADAIRSATDRFLGSIQIQLKLPILRHALGAKSEVKIKNLTLLK